MPHLGISFGLFTIGPVNTDTEVRYSQQMRAAGDAGVAVRVARASLVVRSMVRGMVA